MREVEFIKDFATKKKSEKGSYDSQLAYQLVEVEKVAKYTEKTVKPKTEK